MKTLSREIQMKKLENVFNRKLFIKRQPGIRLALVLRLKCLGISIFLYKTYQFQITKYSGIKISRIELKRDELSKGFDLAKMFINSDPEETNS